MNDKSVELSHRSRTAMEELLLVEDQSENCSSYGRYLTDNPFDYLKPARPTSSRRKVTNGHNARKPKAPPKVFSKTKNIPNSDRKPKKQQLVLGSHGRTQTSPTFEMEGWNKGKGPDPFTSPTQNFPLKSNLAPTNLITRAPATPKPRSTTAENILSINAQPARQITTKIQSHKRRISSNSLEGYNWQPVGGKNMNFEYPEDQENFPTSAQIKKFRKFIEKNYVGNGNYFGAEAQPGAANRILTTRKGEKVYLMSGHPNLNPNPGPNLGKGMVNGACGNMRSQYKKWLSNAGIDHLVQEDMERYSESANKLKHFGDDSVSIGKDEVGALNSMLEKYRLVAENAVNREFDVKYFTIPETDRDRKSGPKAPKKKSARDPKCFSATKKRWLDGTNSPQKKENPRSIDNVNTNHHQYHRGHRRVNTAANPSQLQGINPLRNCKQQQPMPMPSPPRRKISDAQDPSPLPSKPPPASIDTNHGSVSDSTTNLYYFNTSMFKNIDSTKQVRSPPTNGFVQQYPSPPINGQSPMKKTAMSIINSEIDRKWTKRDVNGVYKSGANRGPSSLQNEYFVPVNFDSFRVNKSRRTVVVDMTQCSRILNKKNSAGSKEKD